jgi:hypothetical protein
MASPFPFTSGQVLTAAQLNGIGETTSYTPTVSFTGGSGYTYTLNNAYYAQVNDLYVVWFSVAVTAGSGAIEFVVTLPSNRVSVVGGNARELSVNGYLWSASGTGNLNEVRYARYDNSGAIASGNTFEGFAIYGA